MRAFIRLTSDVRAPCAIAVRSFAASALHVAHNRATTPYPPGILRCSPTRRGGPINGFMLNLGMFALPRNGRAPCPGLSPWRDSACNSVARAHAANSLPSLCDVSPMPKASAALRNDFAIADSFSHVASMLLSAELQASCHDNVTGSVRSFAWVAFARDCGRCNDLTMTARGLRLMRSRTPS